MTGCRTPLLAVLALAVASLSGTTLAGAQDGVEVRVSVTGPDGEPADASVALTPEDGHGGRAYSCRTRGARCRIAAVPPGRYVVTASPASRGRPASPRVVWVPPRVPSVDVRVRLR